MAFTVSSVGVWSACNAKASSVPKSSSATRTRPKTELATGDLTPQTG